MIKASEFVAQARTWIGVPFRHQGRTRLGVDCVGYPLLVMKEAGILPSTYEDKPLYGRTPNTDAQLRVVQSFCTKLEENENGCVILIAWPFMEWPSHVAISDGPDMIHSYERMKKVIKHRYGEPWVRQTYAFYRLPGIIPNE